MKFPQNLFQKKAKPEFNLKHPDVAHLIEFAFKAGGKSYYRFVEEKLIPAGRHKYIYMYLKEWDLRMDQATLKNYIAEFKKILGGGPNKKVIEIGELWKLVLNLESRAALAFEPASVERLAAVVYFDETEDLSTYDRKHGKQKIEHWKKNNVLDFFLTKPIGELLGLSGISITSLEDYIQKTQEILQELTLDQPTPSSGSSSENGSQHS